MRGLFISLVSVLGIEARRVNKALQDSNNDDSLAHRKKVEFTYGSNSADDVDVEVSSSLQQNGLTDSEELNVLAEPKDDSIVYVTQYYQSSVTVPIPVVTTTLTSVQLVTTTPVAAASTTTEIHISTSIEYSTLVSPSPTTVISWNTATSTEVITYWATATLTLPVEHDPVTEWVTQSPLPPSTVTVTVGGSSNDEFGKGFDDGFDAAESKCKETGERAYQSGYVDGAHYGYSVGFYDALHGRPFLTPSFATGTALPTVGSSTLTIAEATRTQPSGQIQYTTLSYFIPYREPPPYGYRFDKEEGALAEPTATGASL